MSIENIENIPSDTVRVELTGTQEEDFAAMLDMPLGPVVNSLMQWGLDAKYIVGKRGKS